MKKQYTVRKAASFLNKVNLYHDGCLIYSHKCWDDELFDYTNSIESEGYEIAVEKEEVEKAKRYYEYLLSRQLCDEGNVGE